ncbi:MAG: fibronectin type III domain-containing protein [Gaiellaceae bacterium]
MLPPIMAAALVGLVVVGGSGAATLNTAQLDNGTCGRNLQLGSDRTASASATPSFVIAGDGGLSRYEAFVDGASIGIFASDGFANVCVYDTIPLADGPHLLTANELQPHSTFTVVPFNFTVDTVPPAQPSVPVIASYSDSGLLGDHITRFRTPNFSGFADPNVSIQLFSGPLILGGAKADANGAWSATTSTLSDGSYVVTATALDQAGNKSQLSLSFPVTIDTAAPTGGLTSPTDGSVLSGTVGLTAAGADNTGVWKVDFQVDGVTKSTSATSPFGYSWNTTSVANGTHTLTTVVHDYPDNTVSRTITVNVLNGVATPTAPATPALSGAVAGDRSVALSWSAPGDGGSPLTGYKLYRSTTSGGETLLATLGTATSYTDAGLGNGTTYYYKLAASNTVGDSSQSAERSSTPFGKPASPALGSATGGNARITLTWSAPSDNGGSPLTGYKLYRSTSSGAETLLTTLGTGTSWTDTGLGNGNTYYYKLTAGNAAGDSSLSNEVSAIPATTPAAPSWKPATAGNGTLTLNWNAPGDNGGAAITGYKLYRSTSSGAETLLTTLGDLTTYTDTGLTNGTAYYYKVSAANSLGDGTASGELSAAPVAPATAPGAPTLSSATAGNASVTLSWSVPASDGGSPVTGYKLYRGMSSGSETLLTTLGTATSWTDTGLGNGTTYYYKLTAGNAAGDSSLSNEVSAIPATTPAAPTWKPATAASNKVDLSWNAPADNGAAITGYKLYRATTGGGETLLTTLGTGTTYSDTGLTNGVTYYYKLSATNSRGESGLSAELSATPAAAVTVPATPALAAPAAGDRTVGLSWSAPADGGSALTGYKLFRSTSSGAETLVANLGTATTYLDAGLANGVTYYYKLAATNGVGDSALSTERFATPATTPATPSLGAPVAGNTTVTLAWAAPGNGGSALTGYKLYRSTSSGAETLVATLGTSTTYTDGGLANGTTYYYRLAARNALGDSPLSEERTATPATTAGAPTLAQPSAGDGFVRLDWTAPASDGGAAVSGYKVYRGTSSGGETLLATLDTATGYLDSGLANGTTYYYRVSATNRVGDGDLSLERDSTPGTVPGAPALDGADAGDSSVTLRWSVPASNGGFALTGYNVYRGTASGGETLLATVAGTSYLDSGAANGTTYYYRVAALNARGEGAPSNERSATPLAGSVVRVPDAPSLDSVTATNPVLLSWTAGASDGGSPVTGYRVYRGTVSGGESLLATLGSETSYSDGAIAYGTTYYYEVTALNAAGESAASSERFVTLVAPDTTPPSKPGAPKALVAGTSQVALNWTASTDNTGITSYRVFRDGTLVATVPKTYFLDAGLAAASTHTYQVRALDASGNQSILSTSTKPKTASLSTSSTGTLGGVVYNAAGRPVSGATVSLRLANGTLKSTTSNTSGVWKLSSVPPAQYTLTATGPGLPSQTFMLTATAGRTWLALVILS